MYGWFVKRLDSGRFLALRPDTDAPTPIWVNTLDAAECFPTRGATVSIRDHEDLRGMPVMVFDATIPDEPVQDADTLPVESFSQIVARAKAAGQPRRDAAAKARAEKGAQPAPFETLPLVKNRFPKAHPKRSKLAAPAIGKPRPKIINAKAKLKVTKRKLPR